MVDSKTVLAEIEVVSACEDEQCLTEGEQAEILRQDRLMTAQREFLAMLQTDLDALNAMLWSAEVPHRERSVTGKGRRINA